MRSGRIRSALITQMRAVNGAVAFDVGGPRFHARHVRLLQPQFGGVFDGDDALVFGDEAGERVEQVVLPEPVPPQIRMFSRAFTQAFSSSSMPSVSDSCATRSSALQRIAAETADREQRPVDRHGGMAALTREPSGRRASTIGDDSSTRRPTRETTFSMMRSRCASSLNSTGVR